MSRTIRFSGDYPWGLQPHGPGNRPYSEVRLFTANGTQFTRVMMVVDTGADHMVVDSALLSAAGYGQAYVSGQIPVLSAFGGTTTVDIYSGILAEIEGTTVTLQTVYAQPGAVDLLGLSAILAATSVGFDTAGWLHT